MTDLSPAEKRAADENLPVVTIAPIADSPKVDQGVANAIRDIVFDTKIARSLIYTERPEVLVGLTAERIWSNLSAYFACGDWPDRRRPAAEIDADTAPPSPVRRRARRARQASTG